MSSEFNIDDFEDENDSFEIVPESRFSGIENLGGLFSQIIAAEGNRIKVFDWDKAAQLIVEHKADTAVAGLDGDWNSTSGKMANRLIWRIVMHTCHRIGLYLRLE